MVAYVCAGCKVAVPVGHLDDGPPAGWFLLAKLDDRNCWADDNENHFCSAGCLRDWLAA